LGREKWQRAIWGEENGKGRFGERKIARGDLNDHRKERDGERWEKLRIIEKPAEQN
jgi:hypothetical protein